jgi:hypothetical protein
VRLRYELPNKITLYNQPPRIQRLTGNPNEENEPEPEWRETQQSSPHVRLTQEAGNNKYGECDADADKQTAKSPLAEAKRLKDCIGDKFERGLALIVQVVQVVPD